MIEFLSISNVATYGNEPEILGNLSKFNFIFGSNGTGKTTISRVIAEAKGYDHCQMSWNGDNKLQVLVYNRDFVDANFNQSNEIKGVFTLGENNIEIESKISETKSELERIGSEISRLKKTLNGDNGNGGKNGELNSLEASIKNKCWVQKQKHDAKLKGAFEGYRNNADNFKSKVVQELKSNTAELIAQIDLEKRAEIIFDETPTKEIPIEAINASNLIGHEANPVLSKRVLGKEDVDITGMIKKLGNSDWVRQGRRFYEKNDGVCPFCQQDISDDFAKSLSEYFDENFAADSKAIDGLKVNYESEAAKLKKEINDIISKPSQFLNLEKLKTEKQLLDSTISGNLQKLENKKKEPSQLIELDSIANIFKEIETLINEANTKITQHNTTVDNITQERKTLTAQLWKFVLEELKTDLSDYRNKKSDLDSAITSLNKQIGRKELERNENAQEISRLEKQTTSIQPTINLDDIYKQFDGKNKLICKSLLSWVHDGSHSVHDDLYVSNGDTTVETYLRIFKEIFEKSGHINHYKMMMGEGPDVEET